MTIQDDIISEFELSKAEKVYIETRYNPNFRIRNLYKLKNRLRKNTVTINKNELTPEARRNIVDIVKDIDELKERYLSSSNEINEKIKINIESIVINEYIEKFNNKELFKFIFEYDGEKSNVKFIKLLTEE